MVVSNTPNQNVLPPLERFTIEHRDKRSIKCRHCKKNQTVIIKIRDNTIILETEY